MLLNTHKERFFRLFFLFSDILHHQKTKDGAKRKSHPRNRQVGMAFIYSVLTIIQQTVFLQALCEVIP